PARARGHRRSGLRRCSGNGHRPALTDAPAARTGVPAATRPIGRWIATRAPRPSEPLSQGALGVQDLHGAPGAPGQAVLDVEQDIAAAAAGEHGQGSDGSMSTRTDQPDLRGNSLQSTSASRNTERRVGAVINRASRSPAASSMVQRAIGRPYVYASAPRG